MMMLIFLLSLGHTTTLVLGELKLIGSKEGVHRVCMCGQCLLRRIAPFIHTECMCAHVAIARRY